MYLFFDTSGNGKPISYKAEVTDAFNWPRMMQISWLVYDEKRKLIGKKNYFIKPHGWQIKEKYSAIHGVKANDLEESGRPVKEVMEEFRKVVKENSYIIAHNMPYNEGIITSEMARLGIAHKLRYSNKYDLMREAAFFTKLPGRGGRYKWPSLNEIYATMFRKKFDGAGKSNVDVAVVAITFFGLLDADAIELV